MIKQIILIIGLFIPVLCLAQDTLTEPGKKNPPREVNPDTSKPLPPEPPDTVRTDTAGITMNQNTIQDYAEVDLTPTKGFQGTGRLTFTKVGNGIKISGEISGLTPGLHGMHIHENGNCDDPEALTAGGHFNPDQMPHGSPEDVHRHTGDLGNITADETGIAKIDITDTKISLEGPNSIIGRAVIVHEKVDDLKSQPAGNSGKRILCGVIKSIKKQ